MSPGAATQQEGWQCFVGKYIDCPDCRVYREDSQITVELCETHHRVETDE